MELGHSQSHYLSTQYLKRARQTAAGTLDPVDEASASSLYSTNAYTAMRVTLAAHNPNNGYATLHVLLDTRGLPVVLITAVNQFQRQFFLMTPYKTFLQKTRDTQDQDEPNADSRDSRDSRVERCQSKFNLEKEFLRRTPRINSRVAVVEGVLQWMNEVEMFNYSNNFLPLVIDEAVVPIQAMIRGHSGRAKTHVMKTRRSAVVVYQKWLEEEHAGVRGLSGKDLLRMDALGVDGVQAAVLMQKVVRRHQQRYTCLWKKKRRRVREKGGDKGGGAAGERKVEELRE